MIGFWIAAAALASLCAAFMIARAARAERAAGAEDPSVQVYRRQLAEVDDLADRGLLDEPDRRQAFAEAGRRLLSAHREAAPRPVSTRAAGLAVTAVAAACALGGLATYELIGRPGMPDAPYRQRLAAWRVADPRTLDPAQLSAVLETIVADRPGDPKPLVFLGQTRMAAGDGYGAIEAFKQAAALAPTDTKTLILLGEAQATVAGDGPMPVEAEATFRKVLALSPGDPAARYFLAHGMISKGEAVQGLAGLRTLREDLAADDPRRQVLDKEIAEGQAAAAPLSAAGAAIASAAPAPQAAMIRGMVDQLAARLKANPDDPQGWARLIRSYGVMGDKGQHDAALARARSLFADRPKDLAVIETEAARSAP